MGGSLALANFPDSEGLLASLQPDWRACFKSMRRLSSTRLEEEIFAMLRHACDRGFLESLR